MITQNDYSVYVYAFSGLQVLGEGEGVPSTTDE